MAVWRGAELLETSPAVQNPTVAQVLRSHFARLFFQLALDSTVCFVTDFDSLNFRGVRSQFGPSYCRPRDCSCLTPVYALHSPTRPRLRPLDEGDASFVAAPQPCARWTDSLDNKVDIGDCLWTRHALVSNGLPEPRKWSYPHSRIFELPVRVSWNGNAYPY